MTKVTQTLRRPPKLSKTSAKRNLIEYIRDADSYYRRVSPRAWLGVRYHRTHRGTRIDFAGREWARRLWADESREIVIKKSSQCGISEWAICEMLSRAMNGFGSFYVLPTDHLAGMFVNNRINQSIVRTRLYRQGILRGDAKSVFLKHMFGSAIKFAGSKTRTNFHEFVTDTVLVDELDLCDQENLNLAPDRLGASKDPRIRRFGNPTIRGFGIDEAYFQSDQKAWHIKCESCGEFQTLDWFVNFVGQVGSSSYELLDLDWTPGSGRDIQAICRNCGRALDRLTKGEWVAANPTSSVSGYHVSKLFADSRSHDVMSALWGAFQESVSNPSKLQRFYNNDLGVAFEAPGAKISESVLAGCAGDGVMPSGVVSCVAGVDVGARLHVHISELKEGRRVKRFVGTVGNFSELDFICRQHRVRKGVIDAMPETHKAREFVTAHHGWLMCFYGEVMKGDYTLNREDRTITIGRTESLDASFETYSGGRVVLPRAWRQLDGGDFVSQMVAPTRIYDDKRQRYVWNEAGRPDHHRHADNYEYIAALLCGFMAEPVEPTWV